MTTTRRNTATAIAYLQLAAAEQELRTAGLSLAGAILRSTKLPDAVRVEVLRTVMHYCTNAALCLSEGRETVAPFAWRADAHESAPLLWSAMYSAAMKVESVRAAL